MKKLGIILAFTLINYNYLLFSQTSTQSHADYVKEFLQSQGATEKESKFVQCEMNLVYEQYVKEDKELDKALDNAFSQILATYREHQELNTSFRLYDPIYDAPEPKTSEELNLFWDPDKILPKSGGFTNLSDGCVNADFETGGASNWSLAHGTYAVNNLNINILSPNMGAMNSNAGQHCIMGPGAGTDPNTNNNLPRVYPGGGAYSLRVGDQGTGAKASRATYTFTVTPQTELFLYHYAVVLEDAGHATNQQPYMSINLIIDGQVEPCGFYYQAASANAQGFVRGRGDVRYKAWETMSIPLTDYMWQTATIEFVTADCTPTGHFGYAYIDAECLPMPNLEGETITCANPTPTLTAPPGADQYVWTGPGIVGPSNTQSIQVNQPGTYNVQVIPVQGPQCGYEVDIEVDEQLGEVALEFDALPSQVCLGEEITFQGSTTIIGDAGPVQTYTWDFDDGNTASTEHASHTFTSPGIYDVSYYAITNTGCEDLVTHQVEVSPIPQPDFTIPSVCEGAVSAFVDQSTVNNAEGDVIVDWSWDFGNGQTSTDQNPDITYADEDIYNVSLTVTTNNGCTETYNATATVYPNPVADYSTDPVCLNDATAHTDLSSVSNAHTSNTITDWDWDFTDGTTSTEQNPSHTYGSEGIYSPTLTVTTNHGCVHSTEVDVVVYPLATVDFVADSVCMTDVTHLVDESTVSNDYTSNQIVGWNWDFGNGNTATDQHPEFVFPDEGFFTPTLTVTTNNGCTSSGTAQITVYPLPEPEFTAAAVCYEQFTEFVDQSTVSNDYTSNQIVEWDWDFENGDSSNDQNPSFDFAAEGLYNPTLTVTTNHGCVYSYTQEITVYPLPEPDYIAAAVCYEDANEFIDLSIVSNLYTTNNIVDWDWDFTDGGSSTEQNPSHDFPEEGIYEPILTVTTDNGCTASTSVEVTVYPLPDVSFSPTEVCLNSATQFTDETTISNAITNNNLNSWAWDFNDGSTASSQNPNHTYSVEGIYQVSLTVGTDNGCFSSIVQDVVVFPNPHADFDIDSVCLNTDSEFQDLSTINGANGDYIDTWSWNFGDGNTSSMQHPVHTYSAENVYQVKLMVKSDKGCSDNITKFTAIYPNPVVNFSPTEVCLEDATDFTDLSIVSNAHTNNANVTWDWDFDDGTTSNFQNPTHLYDTDGVYNVSLTVTTNNNCTTTEVIPVTVNPNPVVSFVGENTEGCSPVCVNVTSTSVINNPSTIVNYKWVVSDGTIYNGPYPDFNDCFYNETGEDQFWDVKLIATSDKGCVTEHEETDFISVYHLPVADFYITPEEPSVMENEVDFHNTSLYADYYEWFIDLHPPTSEENPSVVYPTNPETYYATLFAYTDYGCVDSIRAVIDVVDKLIFWVPNTFTPDNDDYNEEFRPIFANGFDPQSYSMYIYNRWGELIFETHDVDKGWKGNYGEGSTRIVKDGTYIWKIDFKETMTDKRHTYTGHINLLK